MSALAPTTAASTNGDRRAAHPGSSVSTYEALRLEVLDEIASTKVDGGDRRAVEALVRAHVDRHQRTAE